MINKYFIDNYELVIDFDFNEEIDFDDREIFKENGKSDEPRKCRFCNCLESKENPFSKIAHTIPEFLGNKTVITQNECDSCNATFGNTIERELGNYFSVLKPLFRIPSKKSLTKYNMKFGVNINNIEFSRINNHVKIESTIDGDEVQLDIDRKELKIKLPRYEYIPFMAYQAFMKIFLSVLPKKYLKEAEIIKLILNFYELEKYVNKKDVKELELLRKLILDQAKAIVLFIPYLPISDVKILRKKEKSFIGPDFIFVIRVANKAFQFCIRRIDNCINKINVPSIFDEFIKECDKFGTPKQWKEDFSSLNKIHNENETITFGFSDIQQM